MYKNIINFIATVIGCCVLPIDAVLTILYGIITIVYVFVLMIFAMFTDVDLLDVQNMPFYQQSFGIKSFNQFAQCASWVAQRLYVY